MEFAPNNRVLSGELIVFQNEMLDIFKNMIATSSCPLPSASQEPLSKKAIPSRYVTSVILEFLRTLLENSIPQQPSQ